MNGRCVRPLAGVVVVASALTMAAAGPTALWAQGQAPEPLRFEVAAVRPSTNPTRAQTAPGGRFLATQPLMLFIADAYIGAQPLAVQRVLGAPEWVQSARYEVNAKANIEWRTGPDGPPRELLLMLRSLLEDRFRLKAHFETREFPIYELVLARPDGALGPELRKSPNDCDALIAGVRAGTPLPPRQPNEPPPCGAMRGPARVLAGGVQMDQFAMMLTNLLADANGPAGRADARLVVNKTGLSGRFAFTLAWTPEVMPTSPPPPGIPPVDPNGPSFFTALEEQLGLKLQQVRRPLEVVVIDSIEAPTPD